MRRTTLATAFTLAAVAPMSSAGAQAIMPASPPVPFVQVSAQASVSLPADMAELSIAVQTEGTTAQEAVAENAERMEAVIAAVRRLGVEGMELETQGFHVSPRYSSRRGDEGPRIVGYTANNNVVARFDDVEAVGRVIDAGIAAGANVVNGPTFRASNTAGAEAEALRLAVEDARRQATAMASALGASLGTALEVMGGTNAPPPRPVAYARMEAMDQAAPPTPIEPGEQQVYANVTIKFALAGT